MPTVITVFACFVLCSTAWSQTDSAQALTKSPTTAVVYSLCLPGLGQYYTANYWKIPLFTGTCAVAAWQFFRNNADFQATSVQYDAAVAAGNASSVTNQLLARREAFRDRRDISGVIFLVAYGLAAVDAFVGAHLYDFDVSENLSLGLGPTPTHLMGMSLRLEF